MISRANFEFFCDLVEALHDDLLDFDNTARLIPAIEENAAISNLRNTAPIRGNLRPRWRSFFL